MVFLLFTREMDGLGREDLSAAFEDLALTLAAGTLTAASRRQVDTCFAHGVEEGTAGRNLVFLIAVDNDLDVS